MVATNPLFTGHWTLRKFNATVIQDIWPGVLFFTLIATMVCLVSEFTEHELAVSNQLLVVIGTALGLVISFRTSSAYERYQEGRRMWTNITTASRNLSQLFWIHAPSQREGRTELQGIIEKKTMIRLIQAFPVSVKHFLRGEEGVYYEDLYPLISCLPRYANNLPDRPASNEDKLPLWQLDDVNNARVPDSMSVVTLVPGRDTYDPEKALLTADMLKPAHNPPHLTVYDYIPFLRFFKWVIRKIRGQAGPGEARRRRRRPVYAEHTHVPVEICLVLSNYSGHLMKAGVLNPAIETGMTNNIALMSDTFSNLERICNTPLPYAYQVHLRMSLWLYLFFLPFQIWNAFGNLTIPATAFASFLYLGFLEIGREIENPFNYDLNDLDLDHFCLSIQRELYEITAYPCPNPSEFVFSQSNQPFAPADNRNAHELTSQNNEYQILNDNGSPLPPGIAGVRRTLIKGWKEVDSSTRR